jgi:hypothetical protein
MQIASQLLRGPSEPSIPFTCRPQYVVGIVEITEEAADEADMQTSAGQRSHAQLQQAVLKLLLVCALHAAPSSSTSSRGKMPGCCSLNDYCTFVQQQAMQLHSPWSDSTCQQHSHVLLQVLAVQLKVSSASSTKAATATQPRVAAATAARALVAPAAAMEQYQPTQQQHHQQQQQQQQQGDEQNSFDHHNMLDVLLPALLEQLKDTVLAQHRHKTAEEKQGVGEWLHQEQLWRALHQGPREAAADRPPWVSNSKHAAACDVNDHISIALLPVCSGLKCQ